MPWKLVPAAVGAEQLATATSGHASEEKKSEMQIAKGFQQLLDFPLEDTLHNFSFQIILT
jgi:hypothetical protein